MVLNTSLNNNNVIVILNMVLGSQCFINCCVNVTLESRDSHYNQRTERMLKEKVTAYFKELFLHLPGMIGKYATYLVTLFKLLQPVSCVLFFYMSCQSV